MAHSKILNMEPFEPQLLQTRHKAKTTDSEERSSGIGSKMTFSETDSEANIKVKFFFQLINISFTKLMSIIAKTNHTCGAKIM